MTFSSSVTAASARLALATLALTGLLTLLPGTAILPLMDRDEPRFARATVEMMRSGDWVVPYFNGDYRFDKPILTYWLMSIGYRLFGVNEFGARAHSIAAAILTAFALYGIGRRWFSHRAGLLAGFFWLTSLQILIHGRSAVADMPMVLCVVLAQWGMYELLQSEGAKSPSRWFLLTYLALGFGFLAKGPVALFVPALTLGLHRLLQGARLPWRRLRLLEGLLIVAAVAAVWGVPALVQTDGAFWKEGMNRHVVERGLEAFNNRRPIPLLYYPVTFFVSLFPWSGFVGLAAAVARPRRAPVFSFLLAWFLAPFLIFGFYATQLPHYIMPGFPAGLLLLAHAMDRLPLLRPWQGRIFYTVQTLFAVGVLALGLLAVWWPLPVLPAMRWVAAGLALILGGLWLLGWLFSRGQVGAAALPLGLVAIGFVGLGHGLRAVHPAVQLAPLVAASPRNATWAAWKYTEPTLVFYGDRFRPWKMLGAIPDAQPLLQSPERPNAMVVLEREAKLDRMLIASWRTDPQAVGRETAEALKPILTKFGYAPAETITGFNSGRGTWVELRLWRLPNLTDEIE